MTIVQVMGSLCAVSGVVGHQRQHSAPTYFVVAAGAAQRTNRQENWQKEN